MGFSTIVAWIGAFTVILLFAATVIDVHNSYIDDMTGFYKFEKDFNDRYRMNFIIEAAGYSNGVITVDAKNSGSKPIPLKDSTNKDCLDLFIDSELIGRGDYSYELLNRTFDPLIWDPDEYLRIDIADALNAGNHTVAVVDCNGLKSIGSFEVV